jgi:hypothetical protein
VLRQRVHNDDDWCGESSERKRRSPVAIRLSLVPSLALNNIITIVYHPLTSSLCSSHELILSICRGCSFQIIGLYWADLS